MQKLAMPMFYVVMALAAVILQFGFIFLIVALLPAITSYFIDNTPGHGVFKTVLATNFAAAMPSLAPMVQAGVSFKYIDVWAIAANPRVWLTIYGGAAAGWCLIYLSRFIARFLLIIAYEYRIAAMERMQKKLADEWGEQIRQNV